MKRIFAAVISCLMLIVLACGDGGGAGDNGSVSEQRVYRVNYYDKNGVSTGYSTAQFDPASCRIIKENAFDGTGKLTGYETWSYNAAGSITEYAQYDGTGKLEYRYTKEYNADGKLTRTDHYNSSGLNTYEIFYYDVAGNNFELKQYDKTGAIMHYQKREYDSVGNLVREQHFIDDTGDPDCFIVELRWFYNESNLVTGWEEYNFKMEPTGAETYEYNTAGKIVWDRSFYRGEPTFSNFSEYDSVGNQIKRSYFKFEDKENKLKGYQVYEYNTNGFVKLSTYEVGGALLSHSEYLWEEGNDATGSRWYLDF